MPDGEVDVDSLHVFSFPTKAWYVMLGFMVCVLAREFAYNCWMSNCTEVSRWEASYCPFKIKSPLGVMLVNPKSSLRGGTVNGVPLA
jgi:hypothetical protein